jgi:hypothetical protein
MVYRTKVIICDLTANTDIEQSKITKYRIYIDNQPLYIVAKNYGH